MTRKHREAIIGRLKSMFPDIHHMMIGEDWGEAMGGGIHLGDVAEGGLIDGIPACDYNAGFVDPEEKLYVMGVHKKLRQAIEDEDMWIECYDAGTWYALPN